MRLLEAFSFGTEQYPEKVARRLRVLNLACWSIAPVPLAFAAFYSSDSKLRTVVAIDVVFAISLLAMPLLHRFGPRVAAIAFFVVAYPATFVICFLLGTDSGMQTHFLTYAAGAVLVLGASKSLSSGRPTQTCWPIGSRWLRPKAAGVKHTHLRASGRGTWKGWRLGIGVSLITCCVHSERMPTL
jgi:hypothetical protein